MKWFPIGKYRKDAENGLTQECPLRADGYPIPESAIAFGQVYCADVDDSMIYTRAIQARDYLQAFALCVRDRTRTSKGIYYVGDYLPETRPQKD